MEHRLLPVILCGAALMLASPPSRAENSFRLELARKHYELGVTLFKSSAYDTALVEFQKAYRLEPFAEQLYNIARCQEALGQLKSAVQSYEGYLEKKPDATNWDLVQVKLSNIRRRIREQEKAQAAVPPPEPAPTPSVQAAGSPDPAARAPAPAEEGADLLLEVDRVDEGPASPPVWVMPVGWSLVALGGASLVAGVALGGMAMQKTSEHEEAALGGKTYSELGEIADAGRDCETGAVATLVAGGVLAAGGAAVLILGRYMKGKDRSARKAHLRLWPQLTPAGAGLTGLVRF